MEGELLKGKYKIERLLGEGAMGRVYLCRNMELGNLWAVKQIFKRGNNVHLMAEVEILKKLQHIGLPQIVDIVEDETGIFIVESYVDGISLDEKMKKEGPFDEETIISWGKQLCDALIYLHNMKPHPIIYRDMKPKNIMITRDNRPVIVDFGISKEHHEMDSKDAFIAFTPDYAAPEQFNPNGVTDKRTDIYGLGTTLFHVLTGYLPKQGIDKINTLTNISKELKSIILKCIENDPNMRYQKAEELKWDLESLKELKLLTLKRKFQNRVIVSLSLVMTIVSFTMVFLGLRGLYKERNAFIDINPKLIVLSEQQEGDIRIEKKYLDGTKDAIKYTDIDWESTDLNVAVVKNGKILAVNQGKAEITGKYGDKIIKMDVKVNPRGDEINTVNINLKYNDKYLVNTFAGTGEHGDDDGDISKASFLGPTSIASSSSGEVFVVDSGHLRSIKDGTINTYDMDLDVGLVRLDSKDALYCSLLPYETNDNQIKTGIFKLGDSDAKEVYSINGDLNMIMDFTFDSQGNIFVLEQGTDKDMQPLCKVTYLDAVSYKPVVMREIPGFMSSITVDKNDDLYLSCAENGEIYKWEKGSSQFKFFAGKEKDKQFIDGINNRFFEPDKILAQGDYLYVIDQNVIRRIILKDGKLTDVETLAGQADKGQQDLKEARGVDAYFNSPADLVVDKDGNLLVADNKNQVIRKVFSKKADKAN